MPVVDMEMSSTAGRSKKRIDIRTGGGTVVIDDGMMRIEIIIGVQDSGNNYIFAFPLQLRSRHLQWIRQIKMYSSVQRLPLTFKRILNC